MRRNQDTGQVRKSWVGKKPQLCPPPITSLCKTPRANTPGELGSPGLMSFLGAGESPSYLAGHWQPPGHLSAGCGSLHISCFSKTGLHVVPPQAMPLPAAATSCLECHPCLFCWGTPTLPSRPSYPQHRGAQGSMQCS